MKNIKFFVTQNGYRNNKGFVLIATYLILTLVSAFAMASFTRTNAFLQASERTQNRIVAFNMAEAGVDFALVQLANPATPNWTGTNGYVSMAATGIRGGFSVAVTTPNTNPNIRIITVAGFSPDTSTASRGYQTAAITAYGQKQQASAFNFGVFATNSVMMSGNAQTDAYDSRNGAYGGSNVILDGDVGTNAIRAGMIMLSGNVRIQGDVLVGPTQNPNAVITRSGNAAITGTISASTAVTQFPPATTQVASSGALSISGNTTRSIAAGTYRYSSISITGNAQLVPTGQVIIYVDGTTQIAGNGVATQNNLPPNLQIHVTGTSSVQFSGNANFYGAVYAPNSLVTVTGNGSIYGAVVSKDYQNSGNGNLHFDQALRDVGGSQQSKLTVKAWYEQNSLSWGTGS